MNNELLDLGMNGFGLLLLATWRALPLLVIVSLVDLAFGRRLAAKYQALLWTLVVVRLLLPISLPSSWSLHGPLDRVAARLDDTPTAHAERVPTIYAAHNLSIHNGDQPIPPLPYAMVDPVAPPKPGIDWPEMLLMTPVAVWALVAAGALLRSLLAHMRFAMRLRACRELNDPQLVDVVLRECDDLRVRRRPKLKEVTELSAPAVFGLFRVTICLPANTVESLSGQEFRWVLRHELAHVRRRDAWLLSLAAMMRSLHWFNPLAWLVTERLRSHIEAAADELAIRSCSSIEAITYGRLLLRFAERASLSKISPALGLLQFVSGRRLRGRIERLTRDRAPRKRLVRWAAALGTLVLAAVGLTDAAEPSLRPQPAIHLPPLDLMIWNFDEADEGPASLYTYDVTEVLERIRELEPGVDPESILLATCPGMPSSRAMRIEDGRLIAQVTARQHQALTELLDAWRLGGPRQIVVELRIVHADLSLVSSINWVAARIGDLEQHGPRPVIAARITEDQLRRFIRSVSADHRSNILMAPKVTVFNGQSATIADLVERPFVTAVEPQEDGTLQPVVEQFRDGLKVTLRPVTTGDGTIALTFDLQTSSIGEVALANLPFRHPEQPHPNVTVQVPSVSATSVRSTVRLPATESLLIAAPQLFDGTSPESSTMSVFYAITPRLIDDIQLASEAAPPQRDSESRQP